MKKHPPETIAHFLQRSYTAVDGLWFMMVEKACGYDRALQLDAEVWKVMPKIQARKARELLEIEGNSPDHLARCFALKFEAEGHTFEVDVSPEGVTFRVRECHWLQLLREADREHLADEIGRTICSTEGAVWAEEFDGEYDFNLRHRMCAGDDCCEYVFRLREQTEAGDER
ncbi:MAG: DUF6125 family protein [Armatimonadota bacterium]